MSKIPSPIYPNLPVALEKAFGMPPLIGEEKLEDYLALFSLIADDLKPKNSIGWLHVKDILDQSWDIQREHRIKAMVIQKENQRLISLLPAIRDAGRLSQIPVAYSVQRKSIDAFDRRIANNEVRRNLSLREFERCNVNRSNPNKMEPVVIDGEFSEATEIAG
jgi:hypothetical protein